MTSAAFSKAIAGLHGGITDAQRKTLMSQILPIVHRAIVQATPKKTGRLAQGTTYGLQGNGTGLIHNATRYALPVHDGARPHIIEARNAKALAFMAGGKMRFPKRVRHPGNAANPFFPRGLASAMPDVDRILATWGQITLTSMVAR